MTKPVWHKGPPPSLGWWPASVGRNTGIYRWWNGRCWSDSAIKSETSTEAARQAKARALNPDAVEWTDRPKSWPARSKT